MTKIICETSDCAFCDGGDCKSDVITIDEGKCDCYESYTDSRDYREPYWKAMRGIDAKPSSTVPAYRELFLGKRFEFDELVFYTSDDNRDPTQCYLTEKRTGMVTTALARIKGSIDKIKAELPEKARRNELANQRRILQM